MCITFMRFNYYEPENLNLEEMLLARGEKRWIKHIWKFYYILSVIYRHRWGKTNKWDDFVCLSSRILVKVLGAHHYVKILNLLKELKVIEGDDSYRVGYESKGFRFLEPYRSAKFKLKKKVEVKRDHNFLVKTKPNCPEHDYLFNNLKQISFSPEVHEELKKCNFKANEGARRDYYEKTIEFVETGDWFFTYDEKTGRVFNNVTNMPKVFRPHLRLAGRKLVELDVANCQPLLLISLYEDGDPERAEYEKVVLSGNFYEELNKSLLVPFSAEERDSLKKSVYFKVLFNRNQLNESDLGLAFKARFPRLYARVWEIKKESYRNLALHLQSLEAQIMIHGVVRGAIEELNLNLMTVHDSVLCPEESVNEVKNIIEKRFTQCLKLLPKINLKN